MQPVAPSRFPSAAYWVALVLILVLSIAPLILANAATAIAEANGCRVHEGYANACLIGGSDWGDTLYAWFVMGWLVFVSFPLAMVALVIWGIVRLVHKRAWEHQQMAAGVPLNQVRGAFHFPPRGDPGR